MASRVSLDITTRQRDLVIEALNIAMRSGVFHPKQQESLREIITGLASSHTIRRDRGSEEV